MINSTNTFAELVEFARKGLTVRTHSQHVQPGEIFVSLPPAQLTSVTSNCTATKANVSQYISDALKRGARFVVIQEGLSLAEECSSDRIIRVPDTRTALGDLAAAYFRTSRLPFPVVGITGTNGKTTICYLLEHLFRKNGYRVGVLGTLSYRWPGTELTATLTTPDCWQLHELFSHMTEAQVDIAFMEVSSHAIDQQRVAGLHFAAAALTNITQDHLDYHREMEHYFQTKAKLFHTLPEERKLCVLTWDDPWSRRLLEVCPNAIGYGLNSSNPLARSGVPGLEGRITLNTVAGLSILMNWKEKIWEVKSTLIGRHNASNLLAAQALGLALGLTYGELMELNTCPGVPGRLERIMGPHGQTVFIDYAHSPDALENVLSTLRNLKPKRLITVFGCGGNRDRSKRPLMGRSVAKWSDLAVLTSDNPRHEDPQAIIADILPGLEGDTQIILEPDRREAIALALGILNKGDILLIAGKGHEVYQQLGDDKVPFSDQAVVRELLA